MSKHSLLLWGNAEIAACAWEIEVCEDHRKSGHHLSLRLSSCSQEGAQPGRGSHWAAPIPPFARVMQHLYCDQEGTFLEVMQ